MKLLRDFLRLRTPRRSLLVARREARRVYVVTVPAPLVVARVATQPELRNVMPLPSMRPLQRATSH